MAILALSSELEMLEVRMGELGLCVVWLIMSLTYVIFNVQIRSDLSRLPHEAIDINLPNLVSSELHLLFLFLFALLICPCNPSYTMSKFEQTYIMVKVC